MTYDYGYGMTERFARETAKHRMTVLHDDGLYRHLRFREPEHGMYWFDLITIPGTLIFQGDGTSYTFRRIEDMFEFFRGPVGRINPQYWAQKLTSTREEGVRVYQQELMQRHVEELASEAIEDEAKGVESAEDRRLTGLGAAIRERVTDELIGDYSLDRDVVERFRFWADPGGEYAIPRKTPDFEFIDVWEWDCRDYDWWFLWACHAIVWGIACYDAGGTVPGPAIEETTLVAEVPPKAVRPVETAKVSGALL